MSLTHFLLRRTMQNLSEKLGESVKSANTYMTMFLENQKASSKLKQMREVKKIMSIEPELHRRSWGSCLFSSKKHHILLKRARQQDQPNDYAAGTYSCVTQQYWRI